MKSLRIRGGSGLGDSIYVRPIAEHYMRQGHPVEVCTKYPDVFLGSGARIAEFSRMNIDVTAHYATRKFESSTNQWQDVCITAKVAPTLPLRFDWTVRNHRLIEDVLARANGRPIILVHGGRTPMGRKDNFGAELLPEKHGFDAALTALDGRFTVRVGGNDERYALETDLNLSGQTSVSDLIDLARVCDGMLAQCSLAIPLCEAFGKPLVCVWSAKGLAAKHHFVSAITSHKVFSAQTSQWCLDAWPADRIAGVVSAALCVRQLEAA